MKGENNMKKYVVVFLILSAFLFCSCSKDTSGCKTELTTSKWNKIYDSGAEVKLRFENDCAELSVNNADKSCIISGKYIADDSTFVIFVPEIAQNYSFDYNPKNSMLELTFEGNTITLDKCY